MPIAIAFLLATTQAGKAPIKPGITFSSLRADQTVVVDYRSRGCFHRDAFLFRFRTVPGRRGLDVTVTANDPRLPKTILGTITLDADQVRRLDGLLKFYRERREGSSSTVVNARFEFRDGDRVKATESFEDATFAIGLSPEICRQIGMPYIDALTLDEIVRAVREREAATP
jgi:hypothetical protein